MSLSDCDKCWDTPCTCGHEWEEYTLAQLQIHFDMIKKILTKKKEEVTNALGSYE